MIRPTLLISSALAIAGLTACSALRQDAPFPQSTLFAKPWNSGLSEKEPAFQAQPIDQNTFAIRQSLNATFEAPFVYLIFGNERALLIDTGVEGSTLETEIERLIGAWLSANGRDSIPLVVMHSHGHGDHVGGDAAFAQRANTVVVGHSAEDVADFFDIEDWPGDLAVFDLGGRIIDIIPAPGHHPSHVMVFDRMTGILFSGDNVYPGRLYFQCGRTGEFLASINRVAGFAATRDLQWILGGHIEMKAAPGESFQSGDRARRDEHLLELPPSVLSDIQHALSQMGELPVVKTYDDFILFPHPADPRGKQPPDWCLVDDAAE